MPKSQFNKIYLYSLIPLIIFGVILYFLWSGLHNDPHQLPSPLINKTAPSFNGNSLEHSGQILTEKNLLGHVTVLNVFASWCITCEAEHSVLMEGKQDLQQTQIIGLNYKDNPQNALAWLGHYGNPYDQIVSDLNGNIAINYGVYGTPETFVIDKQGIIRYKFIGAISPTDWKNVLLPEVKRWEKSS